MNILPYSGTTSYGKESVAAEYAKQLLAKIAYADDRFLNIFNSNLKVKNGEYLDIGCGTGYLTDQLQKILPNGKVIGIEPSNYFYQSAITTYPNLKLYNLCASELLKTLIVQQNSLDGIMAIQVLPNIDSAVELMTMVRLGRLFLKPGGIFIITDINPEIVSKRVHNGTIKIHTEGDFDDTVVGARYRSDRLLLDGDWIKQSNRLWPGDYLKSLFAEYNMKCIETLYPHPTSSEIREHPELDSNGLAEYVIYVFQQS
jgi:SAM-dependent methyltransferase